MGTLIMNVINSIVVRDIVQPIQCFQREDHGRRRKFSLLPASIAFL